METAHSHEKSVSDDATITRHIEGTLYEVIVSKANRELLFSEHVANLNLSTEETALILSNLQKWFPSHADSFAARTTEHILATPFKVIVESEIGPIPFNEEQPLRQYLAVSYCWRHSGFNWPDDSSVPYAPWPFSKPFVDAVLDERGMDGSNSAGRHEKFRREAIWIDQLCIDQENLEEKRRSIAVMDLIYKQCRKLVILLEDVFLTVDEVEAVNKYDLEMLQSVAKGDDPEADRDLSHLARVCRKVENSRWWSRAWCWHEFEVNEPWSEMRCQFYQHCSIFVTNAPHDTTCKMKWYQLLCFRVMTMGHPAEHGEDAMPSPMERLRKDIRWAIADNRISRYNDSTQRGLGVSRSSIMTRFYAADVTECTVLSDLVSITINLSGLGLYFRGEVSSRDEFFFLIAALALAAGESSPLTCMRSEMVSINGEESWLSRHAVNYDSSIPSFVIGSTRGIHSITPQAIEMDLLFFETMAEFPSLEAVAKTYQIFPETPIRSRPPRYKMFHREVPDVSGDQDSDRSRRLFLAQACTCGLDFILRLWKQLKEEVVDVSYSQALFEPFVADPDLGPAAERLLTELTGEGVFDNRESHLEVLLLFLSWLIDPRSMYYISALCLRVQCARQDSHAMISGAILRATEWMDRKKWRLALPRDLVDTKCPVLRCWILQPADDSDAFCRDTGLWESAAGRWRIVGKMLLLADDTEALSSQAALDASATVKLRPRQFVTG